MLLKTCRLAAHHHSKLCKAAQPFIIPARHANTHDPWMSTYLTIINQKDPRRPGVNKISSYNTLGFRLMNDSFIFGPMLIFENHIFCWNVKGDDEINEASLEFMFHLHPPLDLIIIGYSDPDNKEIHGRNLHLIARKHNCAIELLPTEKAIGIYNFLSETRSVAGALIPPAYLRYPSTMEAVKQYLTSPDTLGLPSIDAEQNFGMVEMPRYQRIAVKKLVKKKKDAEQIEAAAKDLQVKEETVKKD